MTRKEWLRIRALPHNLPARRIVHDGKSKKVIGHPLPRAVRRNMARDSHNLGAWKMLQNRSIHTNGNHVVFADAT